MRINFLSTSAQLPKGWSLEVSLRRHADGKMAGLLWSARRKHDRTPPVTANTPYSLLHRVSEFIKVSR